MPEISVKSYETFFGSWTFFKGGVYYVYHVTSLVGDSLVYAGVGQLEVAAGPGGEDGAVGEDGVEGGGGQRPGLALALGVARGHHPHLCH